jgi:GTPase SAR1 family protein
MNQSLIHVVQWISEVMHFCAGLPIILVGCKKDLRRDPKTMENLRKTSQRPVTPEEVRTFTPHFNVLAFTGFRAWLLRRRSVPGSTWSVQPSQVKVSVRFSNMPPA